MEKNCINIEQALDNLDGDTELLAELAGVLLEELPGQIKKVVDAVNGQQADEIRFWAHSLKGAVSNICAEECQELALKLECSGKDEELAGTQEVCQELKAAVERLVPALKELKSKYS